MLAATDVDLSDFDLTFDRVKNPSAGGLSFEVPGDDPERPDSVGTIEGVVVHHHKSAVLWLTKGSERPDAWSNDGVVQHIAQGTPDVCRTLGLPLPSEVLADCPYNQWGSQHLTKPDGNPKAKATTNQHTLYVLRSGDLLPLEVTVTPSGLRNWNDYVLKRILAKGLSPAQVVTRITLEKQKAAGGEPYSRQVFAFVGPIAEEQAALLRDYTEMVKVAISRRGSGESAGVIDAAVPEPAEGGDFAQAFNATEVSGFEAPELA